MAMATMATLLQPDSSLNTVLSVLLYNYSVFDFKKKGYFTSDRLKLGEEIHLLAIASV